MKQLYITLGTLLPSELLKYIFCEQFSSVINYFELQYRIPDSHNLEQ